MDHEQNIRNAIPALQSQIQDLERQLTEKKRTVNGLCKSVGEQPMYAETDTTAANNHFGIQTDSYFTKPLATAVRDVLERRKAAGLGATPLNVIFELMKLGGFKFDAKSDMTASRSLAIALSKNPTFIRLPGGDSVGLAEWYGEVRSKSALGATKRDAKAGSSGQSDADEPYRNDFAEEIEAQRNGEIESTEDELQTNKPPKK
jgi:hypothetical protein